MKHILKETKKKKGIFFIKPYILFKGPRYLLSQGPKNFILKTKSVIERESRIYTYNQAYNLFLKSESKKNTIIRAKKSNHLPYQPKISFILPTYNSPPKYFRQLLNSIRNQVYQNWELCIADDCSPDKTTRNIILEYAKIDSRIKYVFRKENGHISQASNSALDLATGDFVALVDHDDLIYPNTLSECIHLLNKLPNAEFIYTDEDKITPNGKRFEPHFKPSWSSETLLSGNYITHFALIKKSLVIKSGKFRKGYEGAQDFDLFLRVTEKTNQIYHIPKVLYSWRTVPTSTASSTSNAKSDYAYNNGIKSLKDAFRRRRLKANVSMGEGRGLYKHQIISTNIKTDILIIKNETKGINNPYLNSLINNFSPNKIHYANHSDLGLKIYRLINNKNIQYLSIFDQNCIANKDNLRSNIGFLKIKDLVIVSNKIINQYNGIIKTGIVLTKQNGVRFIDAFENMSSGGYFNFNYSKMTKNFSATTILGCTIDTKFYKTVDASLLKELHNSKEIGLYLSLVAITRQKRIICNPNQPIIYRGKYKKFAVSTKVIKLWREYMQDKHHDPNYNPNLSLSKSDFSIKK